MASVANIVRFLPASGSTGDFVYSSGVTGYRTPVSSPALTDGATYRYRAESSDLSEWEVGEGTWTTATTTMARTTIIHSSTGAKVNFTVAPNVAIVALADQFVNPAGDTMTGSLVVPNASGIKIKDTDASHTLGIVGGSNLTSDRTLTLTTGDANRTLTLTGDSSIGGTAYVSGGTDVAVADGGTGSSTASGAATNLGLGTGDSPQFAAVNIGHATDTTITRAAAGDIAVEGNTVYRSGGTDVAVADGGTGASTLAANAVLLGNGTSALQTVAPGTSGNVLTSNGTTWTSAAAAASGGKAADQQVFTSSGTWTKPSGFGAKAYVLIQCWGAGGGGSRAVSTTVLSGGGGGQYSELIILLSSLGSTETVTIGAGGAGRTASSGDGTAGGNTTFGSWLTAFGGGGGSQSGYGAIGGSPSGAGVAGSGGNIAVGVLSRDNTTYFIPPLPAWQGGFGKGATNFVSYTRADALMGGGGGGSAQSTAGGTSFGGGAGGTAAATAGAGTQPGGGGASSTSANTNGGDGAAGKCVVTVFDGA